AILVISGADGVQGHTITLWRLLERYNIPTFIFVNKMDQNGVDKERVYNNLKSKLNPNIVDFDNIVNLTSDEELQETLAACDEELMEQYFDTMEISTNDIKRLIAMRKAIPCFWGSALKNDGVQEFMNGISTFSLKKSYPDEFGAKVFKITRDEKNNRLTHVKITGGVLKVKDLIGDEKVNQIRVYSGSGFDTVNEAYPGMICALAGPVKTKSGDGIGNEAGSEAPMIEAVLNYQIILPEGCNVNDMLIKLKQLEEEEPELRIVWNEELKEIHAMLMGEIQIDILKSLIKERYDIDVSFGQGNIVYKETIDDIVEGVGHYEPLKHYAEVHLLMEPLPVGSGMEFATDCSEDKLDRNWQRLIMTHLLEKTHRGVLTGSEITDMRITLMAGKAHQKHTEGGDFRQATYRAVRQGLMEATSILLEPYYEFRLEIPREMVGRALSDIEKMYGVFEAPDIQEEEAVILGKCPVSTMRDYHMEVISYTRGTGHLTCTPCGYDICHNEEEIVEAVAYNPEADSDNPTGSVFCAHGAGFVVNWDKVKDYMHLESVLSDNTNESLSEADMVAQAAKRFKAEAVTEKELEEIFARTYGGLTDSKNIFHTNVSNMNLRKKKPGTKRKVEAKSKPYVYKPKKKLQEYVIVDGYNIIFAWSDLKSLAAKNIDSARDKLIDYMSNYQAIKNVNVIIVFDAYKVKGRKSDENKYKNLSVVYTGEEQTADAYIEALAHKMGRKYDVTVATSDGLEQVTVLSQGCRTISATELKADMEYHRKQISEKALDQTSQKNYLLDNISDEVAQFLESLK
ncbi:MAG: TetM/TetW/TetO/TetS family tetracycline resistance ribosomal protection protein, partial [Lachnospiraceae bacterium]|nr:TetM/TetW/TetO/TetS family tetracycline resistance ribosomal protection protein [Lachnospiraceae bacterium]